jgi:hypothetical protein
MEQSDLAAFRRLLCARRKPPGRRRQRHELASPHIGPKAQTTALHPLKQAL